MTNVIASRVDHNLPTGASCPSDEQLHQLIAGQCAADEQSRLTAHLDGCPQCRDVVGRLAGDLPMPELDPADASPPAESALLRIVERIKDESPTSHFGSGSGSREPVPLDFLAPADDSTHLGRLGRYAVLEEIGRGASGIVLKALDEQLGRMVALKVLSPRLATNEHARRRFVREAKAAAAIRDDHVIGIYHVEEVDGLPFLVMEYVVGRSLAQRLDAEGPLPVTDILRIGSQIARGLAAAHAQGLVHRDIKPANILLENGVERVKITDFGLAHAVDDVRTTQPGVVLGTPEYMSPEQARGEGVDHRCDLFSLGCVLYAMCAGRPPFRAESTMAIIRRVCDDTPRPLSEINPEIPGWLADVIDKLIAKDAAERFQSAAEVAELLEQFLAHVQQPSVIPQPASIFKGERWASARRGLSATRNVSRPILSRPWPLAAAILLLLCAGLTLAESTGVTHVAATVIRIVRGDGTLVVEVDDPNIQVLLDGEELVITGAGPKELRLRPGQHELQTVKGGKPAGTQHITITRDGRQVVKVAREQPAAASSVPITRQVWADAADVGDVSSDGRYFAFVDWKTGDLAVRDVTTGKNRRLTNKGSWDESGEFAMLPRFSSDGKRLAFTWYNKERKTELRVISVDGGEPQVFHIDGNDKEAYGWTPDGRSILAGLYTTRDATLQLTLIDVTDGSLRPIKSLEWHRGKVGRFSLAPDGRTIAYSRVVEPGSANRDIFLIDVASGQETRATTHVADTDVLGWVPDGQRLLVTMQRQGTWDAWTIRTAGGQPQGEPQLVKADLGAVSPLGFTGDGTFYYGLRYGGPSLYTAVLDLEKGTATATPLPAEKLSIMDQLFQPTWSPDGRYLAYKANRPNQIQEIRIVPTGGGPTRVLQPDVSFLNSFRWAPDGQSFVSVAQKKLGRVGIYQIDAITGNATAIVEPRDKEPILVSSSPRWSPDGQGIFYNRFGIVYRDIQAQTERRISIPGDSVLANPNFDVSPDGRQLAVWGKELSTDALVLRLVPVDGGASRDLLRVNERAERGWVSWTPDGKYVLFTRYGADEKDGALWYISTSGGKPRKFVLSGLEGKAVQHIAVHPDGRQLAFTVVGSRKSEVWALENFLPPLADSAAPAASDTSAAKSKSAAAADSAAAGVAAREQPVPAVPSTRLVWADARDYWPLMGAASPDDKYLSYVDWQSGDVGVYELATGKNRRLTNQGYPEFGLSPIFSPDSQQVAYYWLNKEQEVELRTIGFDGAGPRVVMRKKEKDVGLLWLRDWSADGKYILATFGDKETLQIGLVSVEDGSVRVLKTRDRGISGKMSLSPDGRYVAYTYRQEKDSPKRNIFLLATDGSGEIPLVAHPADDFVLGWAPDGKRLLFASDRTGSTGAWLIAVVDGKPQGAPELVKAQMGQFHGMGLTRSGSFYYGLSSGGQNVYTATLDLETGQLLSPPVEAMQRVEGSNWAPAWSPDGRYLACLSSSSEGKHPLFYIRSVESKEVRELVPKLREFNIYSLHWSPDGRALLGAGRSEEVGWGPLRIDVETGAVTSLVSGGLHPFLSPDGKALFYLRLGTPRRLLRRELQTGVEQELYQSPDSTSWTLSPDGRQLAFAVGGILKLLPATGGEPRELVSGERYITAVAWTPDGQHLLFGRSSVAGEENWWRMPGELWRVPVTGGEPQKLELAMPGSLGHLRVHPDGRQIAFSASSPQATKTEVWVLENFLPPLADSAPAAAGDASAGKSK